MPLSDVQIAYIAGIVDGEGCIRIRNKCSISLHVTNTDMDLLKWCQKSTMRGCIYQTKKKLGNSKRARAVFVWEVSGSDAYEVLQSIVPYLICKKTQAEMAIDFQHLVTAAKRRPTEDNLSARAELTHRIAEAKTKGEWLCH